MSREQSAPEFVPMIALTEQAARALKLDMLRWATAVGHEIQPSHNAVFASLPAEGARSADLAQRYGITRQSMGEAIRDMVARGFVEMVPDPSDGRAKLVRYTAYGMQVAQDGFDHILEVDRTLREQFGDDDVDATCRVLAGIAELLGQGFADEPTPATLRRIDG